MLRSPPSFCLTSSVRPVFERFLLSFQRQYLLIRLSCSGAGAEVFWSHAKHFKSFPSPACCCCWKPIADDRYCSSGFFIFPTQVSLPCPVSEIARKKSRNIHRHKIIDKLKRKTFAPISPRDWCFCPLPPFITALPSSFRHWAHCVSWIPHYLPGIAAEVTYTCPTLISLLFD